MQIAIDEVGRLVVPKALREELGIKGAATLDVNVYDGCLELTVPDVPAHVEQRDGLSVIVTERPMRPMDAAETREAIERIRR